MMVTPKSFATAWRAICALFLFALATACVPISTGPGGPKIDPNKPVRVALLVPSGSGSAGDDMLAKGLENAARLAISDLQGSKIDLAVYSTAGKTDRAAAMALQAANDGAKIIIGPVYAQNANAAGVAVAKKGLRVLTFSNNTAIAGGNVYVMGASYQNTAERMTAFATRQGKKRLVIVHANTVSGNSGKDAIIKA
ncbi:MAG: ABC transporter substrate-binding protein, partial [Halocynthiibacter sp.]